MEELKELQKFQILSTLSETMLKSIRLFHMSSSFGNWEDTGIFITDDDNVYAIGSNAYGRLGIGKTQEELEFSKTPVKIDALCGLSISEIYSSSGDSFTAKSGLTGEIFSWGNNSEGQCGQNCTSDVLAPLPVNIPKNSEISQISCGMGHILVLTEEHAIYSYGCNNYGQIGNGSTQDQLTPFKISGFNGDVTHISTGMEFSIAVTSNGEAYSWGCNFNGETGLGVTAEEILIPKRITFPTKVHVKKIECGIHHSIALTTTGQLYIWGWNGAGPMGGTRTSSPLRVPIDLQILDIAATPSSNLSACQTKEKVYLWGSISMGDLASQLPQETGARNMQQAFSNVKRHDYGAINVMLKSFTK